MIISKGKQNANETHHEIGAKVRQTIKDLGGTMPEELPTPKRSTKSLDSQQKKQIERKTKGIVMGEKNLPSEWIKGALSTFTKSLAGGTPRRSETKLYKGEIPWVKSSEVNKRFVYDTEEKISNTALKTSSAKLVQPGSTLLALYGATAGKVAILKIQATTNQAVLAINPIDSNLCQNFLFWLMEHEAPRMMKKVQGAAQPNLSKSLIERHEVILPPLPEQKAIVNILQTWDTAIEKTEALIAAKEKQFDWLKYKFFLRNPKATHRQPKPFGEYIEEKQRRSTISDMYLCLTSSRHGMFLQGEYFSKQVASKDNTGYKIMERGDFTFRSMSDDGILSLISKLSSTRDSSAQLIVYLLLNPT